MARPDKIASTTVQRLQKLLDNEATYQQKLSSSQPALKLAIEYIFLSGFKEWENFLELTFFSQSRFNTPIGRRRLAPFLKPKSLEHAKDLVQLEKDFLDWTTPDHVIKRAEILFKQSSLIVEPLKSNITMLRDVKKIRNYIAHGSSESERIFQALSVNRLGQKMQDAGDFLLARPAGQNNHYVVIYLEKFIELVKLMS